MLIENTLLGVIDKEKIAIERLRHFEPEEGYYLAFSGGKDSVCIKALTNMAGVKYDAHYNVTTIDPPELVRFIREYHPDVKFEMPKEPFLKKLTRMGFPQRHRRWCCHEYKERGGDGRFVITGVRRAESRYRKYRPIIHHCMGYGKRENTMILNPIIDWEDNDVWEFINKWNLPYCCLYDEGYKRVGCIFCPMNYHRTRDIERYPKYTELFIKAFSELWKRRKSEGRKSVDRWQNGEEMFWWWINENREKDDGQYHLFGD